MSKIYRTIKRYKTKLKNCDKSIEKIENRRRKTIIAFYKNYGSNRLDVVDRQWKILVELKAANKIRDAYIQIIEDLNKLIP
jgi:hypothetical protein